MKKGVCPKCHSREVFRNHGSIHQRELITISGKIFQKAFPPDRYVCTSCGHVEYYLDSEEGREAVREEWEKVPSQV